MYYNVSQLCLIIRALPMWTKQGDREGLLRLTSGCLKHSSLATFIRWCLCQNYMFMLGLMFMSDLILKLSLRHVNRMPNLMLLNLSTSSSSTLLIFLENGKQCVFLLDLEVYENFCNWKASIWFHLDAPSWFLPWAFNTQIYIAYHMSTSKNLRFHNHIYL